MCGACRAEQRIAGILSSGRLLPSQSERVLGVLRGAAGALSDLLEEADFFRASQESLETAKEETRPPTSGAPAPSRGDKADKKKEPSSPSSYIEECEEEETKEEDTEVAAEVPKATPVKARPASKSSGSGSARPPEPLVGPKSSSKGGVKGGEKGKGKAGEDAKGKGKGKILAPEATGAIDLDAGLPPLPPPPEPPGGEGSACASGGRTLGPETLGLTTAAKASSQGGFEGIPKSAPPAHPGSAHSRHEEARSSGRPREHRRGASPDPIERRRERRRSRSKDKRKRRKTNKGKAKRVRGQEFKAWREENKEKKRRGE